MIFFFIYRSHLEYRLGFSIFAFSVAWKGLNSYSTCSRGSIPFTGISRLRSSSTGFRCPLLGCLLGSQQVLVLPHLFTVDGKFSECPFGILRRIHSLQVRTVPNPFGRFAFILSRRSIIITWLTLSFHRVGLNWLGSQLHCPAEWRDLYLIICFWIPL